MSIKGNNSSPRISVLRELLCKYDHKYLKQYYGMPNIWNSYTENVISEYKKEKPREFDFEIDKLLNMFSHT